jgi:hypothetical protein
MSRYIYFTNLKHLIFWNGGSIYLISKLLKNLNTYLNIVNDVTYKHAKIYNDILCIMGYIKITKYDKYFRFNNIYSDLHACHFCVAQNTKYLNMIFCTSVWYIIGYIQILIYILKKRDHLVHMCTKSHSSVGKLWPACYGDNREIDIRRHSILVYTYWKYNQFIPILFCFRHDLICVKLLRWTNLKS